MKRSATCILFCSALLAIFWASVARALPPPRPGLVDPYTLRYRTSGQPVPIFPKEVLTRRISPLKGRIPLAPRTAGRIARGSRPLAVNSSKVPTLHPLVLLIDFVDRPARAAADNVSVGNLFFDTTPGVRSVANYWNEVSYTKFAVARPLPLPDPGVVGWLRAGDYSTVNRAPYIRGAAVDNVKILLDNVVNGLAAAGFDFTPYDRASDNTILSVIIVQPGYGQEDSGGGADVYSHTAQFAEPIGVNGVFGGYKIADYTIVPSVQYYNDPTQGNGNLESDDPLVGIGVIVHEMGHLLGLPDLYPTAVFGVTDNTFSGVGVFDLMGYGLWGDPARVRADNPAHLSAWSKIELGWLVPKVLSKSTSVDETLRPVEAFRDNVVKLYPNGPGDESQFFLLENRQPASASGKVFDDAIPGRGLLIWRVDNEKMNAWRNSSAAPLSRSNTVNVNPAFLALSVQEADADNTSSTPHLVQPLSLYPGLPVFGAASDFFGPSGADFSRTLPVAGKNRTNSSPTLLADPSFHVFDVGFSLIVRVIQYIGDVVFRLFVDLPYWDVFGTGKGLPSNNVLSIAFDSAGRTWIGTADRGVAILKVGASSQPFSLRSPRVQAMAFDPFTDSMWIGTDNSVEKVRLDQVQAIPALSSAPAISVQSIRVDRFLTKWVAGPRLFWAFTDLGTNQPSDIVFNDMSFKLPREIRIDGTDQITCLAIDNVTSADRLKDVLYIGTANGKIHRNIRSSDNAVLPLNNLTAVSFFELPIPVDNSPSRIHSMEVDRAGNLWVATEKGVFAYDRGDPAIPDSFDLFNPFDLAGDNVLTRIRYFNPPWTTVFFGAGGAGGTGAPIQPRGIAFQDVGMPSRFGQPPKDVVWVAYQDNLAFSGGGALRIDPSTLGNSGLADNAARRVDHAIMKFANTGRGIPAEPPVNNLVAAAGDGSNVWFATNGTSAVGAVRFGSGSSLSLDRTLYLNDSAIATVRLFDEGLLKITPPPRTATVTVTSVQDPVGFPLTLTLSDVDNVYTGTFGFSTSGTDNVGNRIRVANNATVTVRYTSTTPPSTKTVSAVWKLVFPFSDSLFVSNFACFVATAAYGSPLAPEVETLRRFRDGFLLSHPPGRRLVALYYRLSPPLAAAIARNGALRGAARACLVPAAAVAGFAVNTGPAEKAVVLGLLSLMVGLAWAAGRCRGRRRY